MKGVQAGSEGNRQDILDAASLLMSTRGYDATSVADVCRASGFPVGSIYYHFHSKEGLLAAVMEQGASRFDADSPEVDSLAGTPRQRFDAWWDENASMLSDQPSFLRLCLSLSLLETRHEAIAPILTRVRDQARRRIQRALLPWIASVRPDDAEPLSADLARYMLAVVDGAFIAQHADGTPIVTFLDRLREHFVSVVESGATTTRPRRRALTPG